MGNDDAVEVHLAAVEVHADGLVDEQKYNFSEIFFDLRALEGDALEQGLLVREKLTIAVGSRQRATCTPRH